MNKKELYFTENNEKNIKRKADYIKNQKYEISKSISFLKNSIFDTDINSILINKNDIIANFKRPNISLLINIEDERSCSIETINFSRYEPNDSNLILGTLSYLSNKNSKFTFFDIGANEGFYSIASINEFKNVDLHIFEAVPEIANLLNKNLKLNNIDFQKINNFALSNKNGIEKFIYVPGLSGSSSFKNLVRHESAKQIDVETMTLDKYIKEKKVQPDFLKIDVEGAEKNVIEGFHNSLILLKKKPILFIEILRKWSREFGYSATEFFKEIISYGYKCYSSCSNNTLKECNGIDDKTIETNFLFIPDSFQDYSELTFHIKEWQDK